MKEISLRGIRKAYALGPTVLHGIDMEIRPGEFVVIVGPSGCGKSTLLRLIAGLDDCDAGDILIGGHRVNELAPQDRDIAMIFQNYALYPHMTVRENIAFGLELRRVPRAVRNARAEAVADLLQLRPYLDRKPAALSGGQRQRVAMGRAIAREASVFLMDEPLSNLDNALRTELRTEIRELHRQLNATILYVTHDQTEALSLADRVAVLKDGRLQQFDTPDAIYDRPANRFVAGFLGHPAMNFLPAARVMGRSVAEGVVAGLRPEALALHDSRPEGPSLQARVVMIETTGAGLILHCDSDAGRMTALASRRSRPAPGDPIWIGLDPARALLFGQSGERLIPAG